MSTPSSPTTGTTSSWRSRASASASKPGPRFALVAGTRTWAEPPRNAGRAMSVDQPKLGRRRVRVDQDGLGLRGPGDRPLRVLEPVAGDGADHGRTGRQPTVRRGHQQTGDTGGRGRLDEDRFGPSE